MLDLLMHRLVVVWTICLALCFVLALQIHAAHGATLASEVAVGIAE